MGRRLATQEVGAEVTIVELNFEGDLRMPTTDQYQIATSLKQGTQLG